jgi:hypothetical protein
VRSASTRRPASVIRTRATSIVFGPMTTCSAVAVASPARTHIRIDMIYMRMSPRAQALIGDPRRAAHGYEPTREAATAAFKKSWMRG